MYIETNGQEQYEIKELVQIMDNYLNKIDKNSPGPCHKPFNNHYMKQNLLEKYGESVHTSDEEGSSRIVTMRETTAYILRKYHEQPDPRTEEEEKCRIISTAAKFIKADIISQIRTDNKYYPPKDISTWLFELFSREFICWEMH